MSTPPQPPADGPFAAHPAGGYGSGSWSVADPGLPPGPSWPAGSAWTSPGTPWTPPGAAPPAASAGRSRTVALVLVALAGLLVGAVCSWLVASAAFLSSARDIGQEMAAGVGEEIGDSISDGMAGAMEDVGGTLLPEDLDMGLGPVEQSPPVEPGALGPDPVLDGYAQSCFDGELQACDDLFYESAPLSEYERYASTCAGRVKPYVVYACTDLD